VPLHRRRIPEREGKAAVDSRGRCMTPSPPADEERPVANKTMRQVDANPDVDLTISPETVCFIIIKAREFDVKDEVTEPDPGSNPSDDMDAEVLEDHSDDPSEEEIRSAIAAMSVDEQIDLVALAWLGRSDYDVKDWPSVRAEAAGEHNNKTASYLLGMPLLGDYLEEGLSLVGRSCEEFEIDRL
jgi:hypothetical protein